MSPHSNAPSKIGLVQMASGPEPDENLERAVDRIREAAAGGAELIALPELFRTQYFCQREDHSLFDFAEPIPGPTVERMSDLARELKVAVLAPIFERRAPGVYHNSVAVIERDGRLAGIYRKMHIPDDPLYFEKFYFTPGDLGFPTFRLHASHLGVLVCWDQWYPEAARLTALAGAELLVYPTAIGWHPGEKAEFGEAQVDAWRTIQRSHAIANGVYVAAANRVGLEHGDVRGDRVEGPGIEFWGTSFVADPFGQVLAEAPTDREAVLVVDFDPREIETTRQHWPFLRDRRVEAYGSISQRFLDAPGRPR
ncbi:MAG: carbon-nitrogen hydrolase [Thermoplasmata archaeon]